jgi:copper oxidase (laccase) domain-containing protein
MHQANTHTYTSILAMASKFEKISMTSPIYPAELNFDNICAAFTGKGDSLRNNHFSFHRPSTDSLHNPECLAGNLQYLADELDFDLRKLTWPNGGWPHSGHVIKAEEYRWVINPRTGGVMPLSDENRPVAYDGIATRSCDYVLGVQGADCPSVFLYDYNARVIGLVHAGWKPVVRGVIKNAIEAMTELGAHPAEIIAYISPGVGDRYNEFRWGSQMEPSVKSVFLEAGREDMLEMERFLHKMTEKDRVELALALGREGHCDTSFKLSTLVTAELECCGLLANNILQSHGSTILDRYPLGDNNIEGPFRYHSFRRERPHHGLNMSVFFIRPE